LILIRKLQLKAAIKFLILLITAGYPVSCHKFTIKSPVQYNNLSSENWPIYGGQPTRANYREQTITPPLKNIWIYSASSAISPTLVAVDGVVYFTTLDGKLEAIEIATGKKLGRIKTEGNFAAACAYNNGHLIIASRYGEKTLSKYDLTYGKYLWKVDAGDIASEPLVTADGIFISALYNHVDKYNLDSGEKIWSFKSDDQHRSSPALKNDVLVAGCDNGTIYALNARTGALKWKIKTAASVFATPIIGEEMVFVGSVDSTFYALNLDDGQTRWRFSARQPLYEAAATNGQYVLFGASDGQFYCLQADTGEEVWRFHAQSLISTAPLITGGVVYFGSLDRHYYALNLETGQEIWRFETKGRIRTAPVVWRDYLLGASEDRFLYVFAHSDSSMADSTD
jgi:outer membrane protein assembly factor BamB